MLSEEDAFFPLGLYRLGRESSSGSRFGWGPANMFSQEVRLKLNLSIEESFTSVSFPLLVMIQCCLRKSLILSLVKIAFGLDTRSVPTIILNLDPGSADTISYL